ncbi:MAG: hypothetical protein RXP86_02960 [Acidilobus sp.]
MADENLRRLGRRLREVSSRAPHLRTFTERCLNSMRWGGSAALMVIDAALTSTGLSYFTAVVPKVAAMKEELVDPGALRGLEDLARLDVDRLMRYWRNRRAWEAAQGVARALLRFPGPDDRSRLRAWASSSRLEGWRSDPVGSVKGVGLVTYQYLRMMGGVDTTMPDRVVKAFLARLGSEAGVSVPTRDMEFIRFVEEASPVLGLRPIEVTWLAWLVDSEGEKVMSTRYSRYLDYV